MYVCTSCFRYFITREIVHRNRINFSLITRRRITLKELHVSLYVKKENLWYCLWVQRTCCPVQKNQRVF